LEGSRGIMKVLSLAVSWKDRKSTKDLERIIRVPADIRSEHLSNTILQCYLYANPIGEFNIIFPSALTSFKNSLNVLFAPYALHARPM
jgi:hypothetical protein